MNEEKNTSQLMKPWEDKNDVFYFLCINETEFRMYF